MFEKLNSIKPGDEIELDLYGVGYFRHKLGIIHHFRALERDEEVEEKVIFSRPLIRAILQGVELLPMRYYQATLKRLSGNSNSDVGKFIVTAADVEQFNGEEVDVSFSEEGNETIEKMKKENEGEVIEEWVRERWTRS